MKPVVLSIPASEFRTLPNPDGSGGRIGLFFANAAKVPAELTRWRDVNPREIKRTKVWDAIRYTLVEAPERFHDLNRGLTVSALTVDFDNKTQIVRMTLSDPEVHGVIDGGHTLNAVLDVQEHGAEEGADLEAASVFFKVLTGITPDQIAEIAGGLNSSQVVDTKSIENLKGHFDELRDKLKKEPYHNRIAYKMNEEGIDVRYVLYYLAVFDCGRYSTVNHPTKLFGRKEGIIESFAREMDPKGGSPASDKTKDSFSILITRAPEILRLRDEIEEAVLATKTAFKLGRVKAGKNDRIKSKKNLKNHLAFLDKDIKGKIPLGWIMPMLGAFRANVIWNEPAGTFTWKVQNKQLLANCADRLAEAAYEIHQQEGSKPEYVGRNATAWRMCYEVVNSAILESKLAMHETSPTTA